MFMLWPIGNRSPPGAIRGQHGDGKPPVELGVSRSMECDTFCFDTVGCWATGRATDLYKVGCSCVDGNDVTGMTRLIPPIVTTISTILAAIKSRRWHFSIWSGWIRYRNATIHDYITCTDCLGKWLLNECVAADAGVVLACDCVGSGHCRINLVCFMAGCLKGKF